MAIVKGDRLCSYLSCKLLLCFDSLHFLGLINVTETSNEVVQIVRDFRKKGEV